MLEVKGISFTYGSTPILENITFSVDKGANLAIIGESGSGKSTLLNLIYGQFDLKHGEIWWKDQQILGPAFNLVVGYNFMKQVTQEFDLMPFTTVAENIGEFLSNFYPEEKASRIAELIKVVELEPFANVKVKNLSGGQKQRVALARALAKEPEILLLDEPFSHIDNFKKQSLRRNIFGYLKECRITCLVATHDKDDVLSFADEILVLHEHEIIRRGAPEILYHNPKLPLIASFFGEFNQINDKIYYADQIQIIEQSDHIATVEQSYFNGNSWLVKALFDGQTLFIRSEKAIEKNSSIQIQFSS
ncbi:ABC transporter ATP-binding protein [Winogradskyella aurantiaca]|uniref:ABC transporter ATP-binding protein n=1 Tax=Winogradskyella aurantiaca TaxID=2219558 RepID=UPI000E1CE36D|nr:ABC transporter ATP-binding protein [Winogradskyella aurantiaca]